MIETGAQRVYVAIAAVTADIGKEGIGKDRSNVEQRYKFRGIDDVYNALSPIIARHNLCILPRVLNREVTERRTKSGTPLFSVTVEVEFDFVSAEDGSKHTVKTYGEAMDTADKATNKAMSAAYKYAAMQAFCIPTEGDNDADSTTHELAPSEVDPATGKPIVTRGPSKAKAREVDGEMRREIDACSTVEELERLWSSKAFQTEYAKHPTDWQGMLVDHFNERIADIKKAVAATAIPHSSDFVPPNFEELERVQ
jgi:hypothetical protein